MLGGDPQIDAPRLRTQVGVMLQEGGLYPGLKPLELLRLYAAFYDDADDPERLLDVVGLARRRRAPPSGGCPAGRPSVSRSPPRSIGRPRLLFLDEPTAGMDPRARADTWALVRGLKADGTTVVLTTHYMDEAEQLCDRLAILDRGHIVAGGSPAEVTADAVEPCTRFYRDRVRSTSPRSPPRSAGTSRPRDAKAGEYVVAGPPTPAARRRPDRVAPRRRHSRSSSSGPGRRRSKRCSSVSPRSSMPRPGADPPGAERPVSAATDGADARSPRRRRSSSR